METIAQRLKITKFPFIIKDDNGNKIYYEDNNNFWKRREYDINGKLIYYEDSDNFWKRREYDINGKLIYYENSDGKIEDNRPKKEVILTMDEIATKFGIDINQLKIKK